MKLKLIVLGASVCMTLVSEARAAIVYSYVAKPQGAIVYGSTDTLNIYFQETLTNGTASYVASDDGLYSAGVAIVQRAGGTGVTVASNGKTPAGGAVTPNSLAEPAGFSGNDVSGVDGNSAGTYNGTNTGGYLIDITANSDQNGPGVMPNTTTTVGTTITNLYLLGTVTFNVASNANATYNIESLHDAPTSDPGLLDAGTNGNTLSFNTNSDLDKGGAGIGTGANGNGTTFVFSSATPEPSSILLGGLAAAGLTLRRRRGQPA